MKRSLQNIPQKLCTYLALVSLLVLSARQSKKCEQTTTVSTSWCVPPLLPSCLFRFSLSVRERSFLVIFSP